MSFISTIREDIKTVQAQDPAAQNGLVIFLSYPGLHAKWNHVPVFYWDFFHAWECRDRHRYGTAILQGNFKLTSFGKG